MIESIPPLKELQKMREKLSLNKDGKLYSNNFINP
jgi:hypothetical protein